MHTKGLAGQANVFPRDERRLRNMENCGLVLRGWQTGYSDGGTHSHQNSNVPPRPGRMSFVRAGVDLQSIPAKTNIVS